MLNCNPPLSSLAASPLFFDIHKTLWRFFAWGVGVVFYFVFLKPLWKVSLKGKITGTSKLMSLT